nr:immunoglobulin light chain junction region [Macaca mulatta]MPO03762.1 immunoglobulin light chain junction region [Macaca mulatta]MPO05218.1 immunoglobulin light chain junction region [Macaca mulatta]MPO05344.1 immunoglobulin light chain junction region [Macaca mulatta]MPO05482.1 immunoglobulin light chain junction region [Macaca mulatta]
CLIWHNNAYIF